MRNNNNLNWLLKQPISTEYFTFSQSIVRRAFFRGFRYLEVLGIKLALVFGKLELTP
jgi:hypothetical protein